MTVLERFHYVNKLQKVQLNIDRIESQMRKLEFPQINRKSGISFSHRQQIAEILVRFMEGREDFWELWRFRYLYNSGLGDLSYGYLKEVGEFLIGLEKYSSLVKDRQITLKKLKEEERNIKNKLGIR